MQTETAKESKTETVKESKEVTNVKKETVEASTTETKPSRKPSKSDTVDKKASEKTKKNQTPDTKKSGGSNPESSKSPLSKNSPTVVIPLTKVDNATIANASKETKMKKEDLSSPESNCSTSARPRRSTTLKNKEKEENSTK